MIDREGIFFAILLQEMDKKTKKSGRSLVAADIDFTITKCSLMRTLMASQFEAGIVSSDISPRSLEIFKRFDSGEISYEQGTRMSLGLWAKNLEGKRHSDILSHARDFFASNDKIFYPYFDRLIKDLGATHDFYVVTANAQFVAEAVCDHFSLAGYTSSVFETSPEGVFTGKLERSIGAAGDKKEAARRIFAAGYEIKNSIALGDSENDIGMLEVAETAICVNPTPNLQAAALANKWRVIDKTNLEDPEFHILE